MPQNHKKAKAVMLAAIQNIAEYIGIFTYFVFNIVFLIAFTYSLYVYGIAHFDADELVKKWLACFELLFVAPIPILIIYAFKATLIRIYPAFFREPEDDPINMLKLDYAKKTFISSIIGVAGISILKMFLDGNPLEDIKIALAIVFLVVLIGYYYILASHSKD